MKRFTILASILLTANFISAQWIQQNQQYPNDYILWDVHFINQEYGWTFGSTYPSSTDYSFRTEDGGNTWIGNLPMLYPPIHETFFTDINTGYGVSDTGTIYKTVDGGLNWVDISLNSEFDLRSVYFIDSLTGYTIGLDGNNNQQYDYGIFKTIDGGMSWSLQSYGEAGGVLLGYRYCKVNDIKFLNANIGWAVAVNKLLKTTDGGNSWVENLTSNFVFSSLHIIDENKLYFTGFNGIQPLNADGVIYSSDNGGETLELVYECEDKLLNDITFIEDDLGWVVGDSGIILQTSDGGLAWEYQESGTLANLYSVSFADYNYGWICGDSGIILHNNGIVNVNESQLKHNSFNIFPNPATGTTNISYEFEVDGNVSISIKNINGQEIKYIPVGNTKGGNYQLNCEEFSPGIYFITLKTDSENLTEKLIIE